MRTALVKFSGGIDSTCAVIRTIDRFDRVELVTFEVPLSIRNRTASRAARVLQRLYPGRIDHVYLDIRDLVGRIRGDFADCRRDDRRFGFAYSWCLGCKLSMHVACIRHCLGRGIEVVLDGSHSADMHALEQQPPFMLALSELYREYELRHEAPIYREYAETSGDAIRPDSLLERMYLVDHRRQQVAELEALGFDFGPRIGNHRRFTQPQCLFALGLNLKRLLHREAPDAARRYYEDRLPRIRAELAPFAASRSA